MNEKKEGGTRMQRGFGTILLLGAGVLLMLVLLAIAPLLSMLLVLFPTNASGGAATTSFDWLAQGPLAAVVDAAETLQYHISGPRANQYDLADPVVQRAYAFWMASCGTSGQLCP